MFSDTETYHLEFCLKAPLTNQDEPVYSENFYMKGFQWYVYSIASKTRNNYFGIFLTCVENGEFKFNVRFSFKLISSINKDQDVLLGPFTIEFTSASSSWGSNTFVSLTDLKDGKQGFLKNGIFTLKLDVTFC